MAERQWADNRTSAAQDVQTQTQSRCLPLFSLAVRTGGRSCDSIICDSSGRLVTHTLDTSVLSRSKLSVPLSLAPLSNVLGQFRDKLLVLTFSLSSAASTVLLLSVTAAHCGAPTSR